MADAKRSTRESMHDAAERSATPRDDAFYVGYAKMPAELTRFLRGLLPALLLSSAVLAWLLARAQNDPGDGLWDSGVSREFSGLVLAEPYPHLRITGESGAPETLLLVEVGKFGGGQRAAAFDGSAARISGWVLERDGRRMLEMEPGDSLRPDSALTGAALERLRSARVAPRGRVRLRGEIVDSKCYLGAMKPGEGRPHKECATLCIAGGIPPMLVTADAAGRRSYALLTDSDGRGLAGGALRAVLPFVADAVEVSGVLEQRDDVTILRLDRDGVRRL